MKRQLAGSLALGLILVAGAYGAPQTSVKPGADGSKQITVRIHNYAQVESGVLVEAERTTDDILRAAGVGVVWLECSGAQTTAKDPACATPMGPTDFWLNLLPRSMSDRFHLGVDAFGVALEDAEGGLGFDAWIFCDLVKDAAAQRQLTRSVLLGTVIAHELGHLLLSTNSHSAFGLMRANWSGKELLAVEHQAMHLSSSESKRIQEAMIFRRQSRERQLTAKVQTLSSSALHNSNTLILKSDNDDVMEIMP